ncbi:IAA-alanine resistance protein 1 [Prunus yedoensis var. nudiflora]|uniref:IAA-alanine resistance protein 1 n=1 Tax=Prunus yedoensis var. nudiflora TaxID=2094558 RepID=A0A314XSA0_PRUYE|nr:IAA-alanine resistance protein 1 [Prunus yedoensis var. nudiflora]
MAEEEDMKLYGFGFDQHGQDHGHDHEHFRCFAALSYRTLVSFLGLLAFGEYGFPYLPDYLASNIRTGETIQGWSYVRRCFPSSITTCFWWGHSSSHDDHVGHSHHDHIGHEHSHSHSLKDLSVGLSILAGIVLFLLVEKLVRYVEENSGGSSAWSHGHHHHHHKTNKKLKDDNDSHDDLQSESSSGKDRRKLKMSSEEEAAAEVSNDSLMENNQHDSHIRKRNITTGDKQDVAAADDSNHDAKSSDGEPTHHHQILCLHNFTDGMALGSAFLLHGSVGGWSRTLFLLAHEIPQEVGDFGILVRSGFSVSKALFFNFLSALVALVGTAMALLLGKNPGQSSLIEGFTAGGFIYIAVAGVLAEMNNNGSSSLKSIGIPINCIDTRHGSCPMYFSF